MPRGATDYNERFFPAPEASTASLSSYFPVDLASQGVPPVNARQQNFFGMNTSGRPYNSDGTMNTIGNQVMSLIPAMFGAAPASYRGPTPASSTSPNYSAFMPPAQPTNDYSMFGSNVPTMGGGSVRTPYTPSPSDAWLQGLAGQGGYLQNFAQAPQFANTNTPDMSWLRNYVQNGAGPIDQTDAWQKMVAAQERNVQQRAGDLNEYFNTMGGRFSTSYGTAMGDYQAQTAKDQNALLAALQTTALENAANRQMGGGSILAQLGYGGQEAGLNRQMQAAGQLSNQAYQGQSLLSQLGQQRFLNNSNQDFQAAMYNAQAADQAAQAMAQYSAYGAGNLLSNSSQAAQLLYGTENAAAGNLFNTQNSMLPLMMQLQLGGAGLNNNAAGQAGGLLNSYLGLGNQIGTQQYATLQDQLNRGYQEWLRTQPQYNPLTQMMQQLAMAQSGIYFPQYTPSTFSQIAGFAGSLAPYIGSIIKGVSGGD